MKIAIPVNNKNKDAYVSNSFGRAPYYLIYDSKTKSSDFIENSAISNLGGAGIRAAQILVDQEIDILLTPRCGINANNVLKTADIIIYQTSYPLAIDNINAFLDKKLSLLKTIHAGLHTRQSE